MKAIVTGGAGFVGCNAAARLIREGHEVVVLDNLSRPGAQKNLDWLSTCGDFTFVKQDIRNAQAMNEVLFEHRNADLLIHLAGQVAVTTSVEDPRTDFSINIQGTLNLLEAVRTNGGRPFFVFASTNKVYGKMDDLAVEDQNGRWAYRDVAGAGEDRPLDFYSPYGCSKGAADQYVRDYARIFGLRTCVFRMSCIYGPRQFGVEDQGWVAWFVIASVLNRPITIYGDGKQSRDILYVDDLVDLYLTAYHNPEKSAGRIFNAGGGPDNAMSLLELIAHLERRLDKKIPLRYEDWRPGDQLVYVSDTTRAKTTFDWEAKTGKEQGVNALIDWVVSNKDLFE